jgi:hypothetical protein
MIFSLASPNPSRPNEEQRLWAKTPMNPHILASAETTKERIMTPKWAELRDFDELLSY